MKKKKKTMKKGKKKVEKKRRKSVRGRVLREQEEKEDDLSGRRSELNGVSDGRVQGERLGREDGKVQRGEICYQWSGEFAEVISMHHLSVEVAKEQSRLWLKST